MDGIESRAVRSPRRRRPISVESFVRIREEFLALEFFTTLVGSGLVDEQADRLAKEALRRTRRKMNRALPDVTKADLKSLKVRRSP